MCWRKIIKRLVLSPLFRKEGVIRELQRQGVAAIHIAVAKENIPAQKLYRKTSFDFCGEADMYGHSYFLCERTIEICSMKENDDHTR